MDKNSGNNERDWKKEIEIAGSELLNRIKEIIKEGNIRKLIIRKETGEVLLEIPLTAGVAVGGAVTLLAPVLAALGALAALVTRVRVEIVMKEDKDKE